MIFTNRVEAGHRLACRLGHLRGEDLVVLGLPRGGVPVAYEVALALRAPLDVIVVRKLRVPLRAEPALGAIAEDDARVVHPHLARRALVDIGELPGIERDARRRVARQAERLRDGRERIPLSGRTAVIVDDGVDTGATARAACQVAGAQHPAGIVLAVPVADTDAVAALSRVVDEVVCLHTPPQPRSVSQWYRDFTPVAEEEIADLLRRTADRTEQAWTGQAWTPTAA